LNILPPGIVGPVTPSTSITGDTLGHGSDVSLWIFLLPYIEQDNAYKLIQPILASPPSSIGRMDDPGNKNPNMPYWFDNPYDPPPDAPGYPPTVMYTVGQTKIKAHICPSGPINEPDNNAFGNGPGGGWLIGGPHVTCISGSPFASGFWYEDYNSVENLMPLGITHYAGSSGLGVGNNVALNAQHLPWNTYEGVFTDRSTKKLTDILDGTSNTVMIAESSGRGHQAFLGRGNVFARSWVGSCCVGSAFGTTNGFQIGFESDGVTPRYSKLREISSYHPGTVNCCFADGSVRGIRAGIPDSSNPTTQWYVLQQICGVKDGSTLDASSVLP
jgi:prepilin-type processing-associated H-X9-DG protein